jgi:hypothetical protein
LCSKRHQWKIAVDHPDFARRSARDKMLNMVWLRSFLRKFISALTAGLLLAIIGAVIAEFFIQFFKEKGWYDKPSERLDVALNAFVILITQPWILIIASFLVGLTIGLWTDSLLRWWERHHHLDADATVSTQSFPSTEPMGMLDYILDGLRAIKEIGSIYVEITRDTTRINRTMNRYKNFLLVCKNLNMKRKLLARLGGKIGTYSQQMHGYAARMHAASIRVEANCVPVIERSVIATNADFEALLNFRTTVTTMLTNTSSTVDSMQVAQQMAGNLIGISRDMNSAASLFSAAIDAFIAESRGFNAVLERLSASCDQRLGETQTVTAFTEGAR